MSSRQSREDGGYSGSSRTGRSPVITAQERKRMILERRRRRNASRSNSLLPSNDSLRKKNVSALKRSKSVPIERTQDCPTPPERKVKRLRSVPPLIAAERTIPNANDVRPSSSRRSSCSTRSLDYGEEEATKFACSKSSHCLTPLRNVPSLFGAVMQNTGTELEQGNHDFSTLKSTTIQRHVMWNVVSTPSKRDSLNRGKSRVPASPGGFGLLKMLDSVTSPFKRSHSPAKMSALSAEPDRLDKWYEAELSYDGMGILDWSLKRFIRIECHPRSCLPGSNDERTPCSLETLARLRFLGSRDTHRGDDRIDWEVGLLYWQHPANHPVKLRGSENATNIDKSAGQKRSSSDSTSIERVVEGVPDDDSLFRQIRQLANPTDDESCSFTTDKRDFEWQEAFRSLYHEWQQRLDAFQNEEFDTISFWKRVRESSFYSISKIGVVLFRATFSFTAMSEAVAVPTIVISGASEDLHDTLKSMQIEVTVMSNSVKEKNNSIVHLEKENDRKEALLVKEELEALRMAQATGKTAGADVSVSMKKRNYLGNTAPKSLCIMGEDCHVFFEAYFNTAGRLFSEEQLDVPLLLSRKLGPFTNSSLRTLSKVSRTHEGTRTVELQGPILPCALDELVRAAVKTLVNDTHQLFMHDKSRNAEANGLKLQRTTAVDAEDPGSHYLVLQSKTLNASHQRMAQSAFLNDYRNRPHHDDQDKRIERLGFGEALHMVVWDIERPKKIVYKKIGPGED